MKVKNRLKKNEEIEQVIKSNQVILNKNYKIIAKKNDLNRLRICISVSKKIGDAVTRVKIRRQIRAMINIYNHYDISYDVVIIIRYGYLKHIYSENQSILFDSLDKLLIKEK